jgi:hypothetical protein
VSDIQRWHIGGCAPTTKPDDEGAYVTYADHVEALRQAEQCGKRNAPRTCGQAYDEGQRDALAGAVQRAETRRDEVIIMVAPGDERALVVSTYNDAIAAIKGGDA